LLVGSRGVDWAEATKGIEVRREMPRRAMLRPRGWKNFIGNIIGMVFYLAFIG